MAHAVQFVDSIAASPTVRLSINSGPFNCYRFDAPPPPLRLAAAENMMRDGGFVSSSSFGDRTLSAGIQLVGSNEDAWAADWQTLVRELNRPTNIIRYLPEGATSPVFFKTYRAAPEDLAELVSARPRREVSIPVRAEPFALGLRETIGPRTITNDPASGTHPCYTDLTGIVGDVAAPLLIKSETSGTEPQGQWIASTSTQLPSPAFLQCESMTLGTNTTNPGGSADSAMSGSGSTNFVRTSFSNAAMVTRLTCAVPTVGGRYRALVAARETGSGSQFYARGFFRGHYGPRVAIPFGPSGAVGFRRLVDLGVVHIPRGLVGETDTPNPTHSALTFSIEAERTSWSDSLDWDCLTWLPVDESSLYATSTTLNSGGHLFDGTGSGRFDSYASGDPLAGTAVDMGRDATEVSGSFPYVTPNVTNRVHMLTWRNTVATTRDVTFYYWPRYLHVRPATT